DGDECGPVLAALGRVGDDHLVGSPRLHQGRLDGEAARSIVTVERVGHGSASPNVDGRDYGIARSRSRLRGIESAAGAFHRGVRHRARTDIRGLNAVPIHWTNGVISMPTRETIERARKDKREGKAPSTH